MKSIWHRIVLFVIFIIHLATLFLDWHVVEGLTSVDGFQILTKNVWLSGFVICLYCISLIFYNKNKKVFFVAGLCSLSALFALEFSAFETYGRFNNSALGVYLGISTAIVNLAAYVLLLRKTAFE